VEKEEGAAAEAAEWNREWDPSDPYAPIDERPWGSSEMLTAMFLLPWVLAHKCVLAE
jgi:hypothetical protein